MFRSLSRKRRFGFTLVEVLVTTVVIGVLAAVVLPALAKQTSAADPARIASDLNNIKLGVEVFSQNLRPDYPGDLEDLVNQPQFVSSTPSSTTDDFALDGFQYANQSLWNGPYLAQALPAGATLSGSTTLRAGAAGFYENDLKICDITSSTLCAEVAATGGPGAFVTVQLNGLSVTEANGVDVMLDGSPANSTTGLFRYSVSGTATGFYYMIPYAP
ncbi:MAG: prepilin-type N-terminal cleavage/methylation domain-containing protein [Gemmatimonadaceae bacterium]|nr:prepilin-type N-terminal cleavage/methylation domain-containing protein [Gemmatimonadaceae bacterium]